MGVRRGSWRSESFNKLASKPSTRSKAKQVTLPQEGVSRTDHHMANRAVAQDYSNSGVSEHRMDELIRATVRDPESKSPVPLVVNSASYIQNRANKEAYMSKSAATTTSTNRSTSGNTIRQAPEVYSPLFQIANLQLPRDRITMNAWNRNFYDTHPLVHNCINLHATYPINKLNIKCKDRKIEQFFNDMVHDMDLINVVQNIALEYWRIGEAFPYAELDEHRGVWKNIIIQNPDYMHVKTSVLSGEAVISMRPDAALQRLIQSNNPADIQLRNQISDEIVYHVRKGNNIPLDNFHVSHLKLLSSPYDIHGTSPIVSVYKDLMLYDKLRESKFAQADNLVNPITLIKVGGSAEGEYHPTGEDLENYRQVFEAAQYDKDFKVITHAGVAVERVGASGSIIDISGDMTFILDNILYGLMVPKAVVTQEGSSFNSATVGLEVLKQRYESFRNMMSQWLTKKIFAPISEIQEFYEYKDGDKKLIVPDVEWNRMILFDMDNYINVLNGLVDKNKVSQTTLFRSLGLNVEEERRLIKEEMIHQTIMAREAQTLQTMELGALRSLKPEDDIIEPTDDVGLPGTPGAEEAGMPGMGAGLPGMDMGAGGLGAPPMPGMGPDLGAGPPMPGMGPEVGGPPMPGGETPPAGGGAPPAPAI